MSTEPQPPAAIDRRRFLTVLGATSAGAAVLSGCSTERVEKLIPYLVQSEDQVPGVATYYASTCTECRGGCGLHVRVREGRAVKLEGNPEHPVNRGALCSRGQASLQGLYNPGRIKAPMLRGADGFKEITWDDAIAQLAAKVGGAAGKLAVISGASRGTFSDLLGEWTAALGGKLAHYEALDAEPVRIASKTVFGREEAPVYEFANAKYILSFGADFLATFGASIESERGYAASHGFHDGTKAKHVDFSPRASLTGLNADEWIAIKPGTDTAIVLAIANVVLNERANAPADAAGLKGALAAYTPEKAAQESGVSADVIKRVAHEFAAAQPSLAIAGGIESRHRGAVDLCAAVNILNYVAGNIGQTVRYGAELDASDGHAVFAAVATAMAAGQIAVAIVHEANPLFSVPRNAGFKEAFAKVPFKVCTSLYMDETAAACDLLLPNHHALERWDDSRPRAGVLGLMQPVMTPVFNTRATGDVLLQASKKAGGALAGFTAPSYEAHLKTKWAELAGARKAGDADTFWREALARGGVYDAAPAPIAVTLASTAVSYAKPAFDGGAELVLLPHVSPHFHDGRGANKPWLLEVPDPVTKITWSTWVEIHPETAKRLNVIEGDLVRLKTPHGEVEVPAYVYPGIHPDVLSLPLGLGHTDYGQFATARGVNPLDLIDGKSGGAFLPYLATTVEASRVGPSRQLAKTEGVTRQLGRGIAEAIPLAAAARGLTIEEAYKEAGHGRHEINTERELEALKGWREEQVGREDGEGRRLGNYAGEHPSWGLAVDLSRCTGCSACITACYAENNIPVVGEDQVRRGREMTWLRIERYWEGGTDGEPLEARFVPMMCQHCDNAPCEPVCPVYAAYHTPDGLNGQVYNRCVGTRYCSNNCPYKVRYFNWYKYNETAWPEPLNLQLNPDVTVRARGVMEKCTMCVQRIRGAQNQARLEGRPLKDGEFTVACAQACASESIVFGDVNDPNSRVAKLKQDPRGYRILEEQNTRSAITYLAKVLHGSAQPAAAGHHEG